MTLRNFTMTFDEGRMSTWRLPRRSAFTMLFCDESVKHRARIGTGSDPQGSHSNKVYQQTAKRAGLTARTNTETRTILTVVCWRESVRRGDGVGLGWLRRLYSCLSHFRPLPRLSIHTTHHSDIHHPKTRRNGGQGRATVCAC